MHWLKAFDHAMRAGHRVFLFTGNVGDGFPRFDLTDVAGFNKAGKHKRTVDTLDRWGETVAHVLKENKRLLWQYDLARGFHFPRASDEGVFRALVEDPDEDASNDPFAGARNTLNEKPAELPARLDLALEIIMTAYRQAGQKNFPLIGIMPDIDSVCSQQSQRDKLEITIALFALQLAGMQSFAGAGHMLLMSAPSASVVNERLVRPDSPVFCIRINKPTVEERQEFLQYMCRGTPTDLSKDRASAEVAHESEKEVARVWSRARLEDENVELERHLKMDKETFLEHDPSVRALKDAVDLQENIVNEQVQGAAHEIEKERIQLERERETIRQILEHGKSHGFALITTAKRWKRLRADDTITLTEKNDIRSSTYRVLKRRWGGLLELSFPNALTLPQVGEGCNRLFSFSDGVIYSQEKRGDEKIVAYEPEGSIWCTPFEIARAQERLAEIEGMLSSLGNPHDVSTKEQRDLQGMRRMLSEQADQALENWTSRATEIRQRIVYHERQIASPDSAKIRMLASALQRIEVAMAASGPLGYFAIPKMGAPELARIVQGFGYRDVVHLLRDTRARGAAVDRAALLMHRQQLLEQSYGHLFEVINPSFGFDQICGNEHMHELFREVAFDMQAGNYHFVPMGCLVTGPPGTGKTMAAMALAKETGILCLKSRNTRDPLVGETERKDEMAYEALFDLAPCIWIKDEVDQGGGASRGQQHGDSGVTERKMQKEMQFLSDPAIRGRIFVVQITNRPDLLDAALVRSGRCDERLPVLLPDDRVRAQLFDMMIKRHGFAVAEENDIDYSLCALNTEGLTGADIEVIVRHAARHARRTNTPVLDQASLKWAIEDFIPDSATAHEKALMTASALMFCSSKSHLPENLDGIVEWVLNSLEVSPEKRDKFRRQLLNKSELSGVIDEETGRRIPIEELLASFED